MRNTFLCEFAKRMIAFYFIQGFANAFFPVSDNFFRFFQFLHRFNRARNHESMAVAMAMAAMDDLDLRIVRLIPLLFAVFDS